MTAPHPVADTLAEFCRRHHVRRLSLFGSVLKGSEHRDSDVDLLVEFEPGKTPGLIALSAMEQELSSLYGGRKVDLRTANDLSRHFREEIIRSARLEYAA